MLVTLLRVFTWLWAGYAVLLNALAKVAAFFVRADPWDQIVTWHSPLNLTNWRYEARLFSPAFSAHFPVAWLSRKT